ncbi:hypothetical protein B0H11DRAFT_1988429 [Mycena galericulata]|nr:hypothetical protein B0H11DRAFT_1988429 [Mycena galericulata]
MAEPVTASFAALEIAVKTTTFVRRRMPSVRVKEGFALLHNGMLLLYQEFDHLPMKVKSDLLKVYDQQSASYADWDPKGLNLIDSIHFAKDFYAKSKRFHKVVEKASSDARSDQAKMALQEDRLLHPMSQNVADILDILKSLDHQQRLEMLRGKLHIPGNSIDSVPSSSSAYGDAASYLTMSSLPDQAFADQESASHVHLFIDDSSSIVIVDGLPETEEWDTVSMSESFGQ